MSSPQAESQPQTQKSKKPTPTQIKAELEDLKESTQNLRTRQRDTEVLIQRVKNVLKDEGTPGASIIQDHYRLKNMVDDCRKILGVEAEIRSE